MKTKILLKESSTIPLKLVKIQIKNNRKLKPKEEQETFLDLEKNWNKIYKKFSNVIFSDLNNSKEPIEHMLTAIKEFSIYYNAATDEIKQKVATGSITTSELRGFVKSKKEAKKSKVRTENRVKCRNKVNLSIGTKWSENSESSSRDFEVIYVGNDWTVVYPKTLLGSISWAVGLADGSEEVYEVDENGTQIGRVTWCTASYENNRFHMYAGNLHMYYFVKNSGYNINSIHRRLCISLRKKDEKYIDDDEKIVEIDYEAGATVNAKNEGEGVSSLEEIKSTVNNDMIIDLIKSHALTKKVTSIEEMSSKVTLSILKQDEVNLREDKESLNNQIGIYLKYAEDDEVVNYIINNYKEDDAHLEFIYDEGPLPLLIFERKDIAKRLREDNLIDKLINLYEGTENVSTVFNSAIHAAMEAQEDFFTDELKDKMINYLLVNPDVNYLYVTEMILTNNIHDRLDLSDIVKILTFISKKVPDNSYEMNSLIISLLQEFYIADYKNHSSYREAIKLMKYIYSKADDRLKKRILSNHNYIFENTSSKNNILKKYIKLTLI